MRATTTSMVDQAPTISLARMTTILSMAAPTTTATSSGSMAAMATTTSMATPATTFSMATRAMTCASAARALTWQPLTASKRFQLRGPRRLAAEHPPPPRAPFCGRYRLRGSQVVRYGIGGGLSRFWRIWQQGRLVHNYGPLPEASTVSMVPINPMRDEMIVPTASLQYLAVGGVQPWVPETASGRKSDGLLYSRTS